MNQCSLSALFIVAASFFLFLSCGDEVNLCSGVECSGHGTCRVEGSLVWCDCESGFQASGLNCVRDGSDGDVDTLPDSDSDSDPDSDFEGPETIYFEDFEDGIEGWTNLSETAVWVTSDIDGNGMATSGPSCWQGSCPEGIAVLVSDESFELPEDGRFTIEFDLMTDYIKNYRAVVEVGLQNADREFFLVDNAFIGADRLLNYYLDVWSSLTGTGADLLYIFPERGYEDRAECWYHDWNYDISDWYHVRLGFCSPEGYTLEISHTGSDEILHSFSNFHNTTLPTNFQSARVFLTARGDRKNVDNIRVTRGCTWQNYPPTRNCPWL